MLSTLSTLVILTATSLIFAFVFSSLLGSGMTRMVNLEKQEILDLASFDDSYVTEATIRDLPGPVNKWLKNSGMIGKPVINTAYVKQKALMKMKSGDRKWKVANAVQYTIMSAPAFIWTVEMNIAPLIKIRGRDKFIQGKGEMLIKINSLFNVVREYGERIDEGTLQRYLGEIVWYPSLALSPYITWEYIDESSAKAIMNYKGTSGSGVFYFNREGDFIKFIALRYMGNNTDDIRVPWELTVDSYEVFDGIKVPSRMKATWKLEDIDWTWLDLEVTEIKYNMDEITDIK